MKTNENRLGRYNYGEIYYNNMATNLQKETTFGTFIINHMVMSCIVYLHANECD